MPKLQYHQTDIEIRCSKNYLQVIKTPVMKTISYKVTFIPQKLKNPIDYTLFQP